MLLGVGALALAPLRTGVASAARSSSASHPAAPSGARGAILEGISCPRATACMAVGNYLTHSRTLPLTMRWNGRKWALVHAPHPAGSAVNYLIGVSCTSPRRCLAVGARQTGGLSELWKDGKWTIKTTPKEGATSQLTQVSCVGPTDCRGVGYWVEGMLGGAVTLQWSGSSWTHVGTPTDGQAGAQLNGVSCPSAASCTSVGLDSNNTLAQDWAGSTWATMSTPNVTGATVSELKSVSCTSRSACMAVGWSVKSASRHTLAMRRRGGAWSIVRTPNPSGTRTATLQGVACVSRAQLLGRRDQHRPQQIEVLHRALERHQVDAGRMRVH